ncbi:MAG: acyltransferase domain-containing protein, partial [Deltaproteobacteria bacterium]
SDAGRAFQIVEFSARSIESLERLSDRVATFLETRSDVSFADLCYTLRVGRKKMPFRRAVVASSALQAATLLQTHDESRVFARTDAKTRRDVCLMFPGAGAHQVGMAAGLYRTEPVFRQEMDRCLDRVRDVAGIDARAVLYPGGDAEVARLRLQEPAFFLAALFAVEYSLAKLWISWGIVPSVVMGHSAGEYVAACIAGVMSVDDAIRMNLQRVRGSAALPPAAMLTVGLPEAELRPLAEQFDVDIAIVNSPTTCMVAGLVADIDRLEAALASRQVDTRRLAVSGASHCRLVAPLVPAFRAAFEKVRLAPPKIAFISAMTGKMVTAEVATPGYWVDHYQRTVHFSDALETALADPARVLLEVGPGTALSSLARQVIAARGLGERVLVSSMRRPNDAEPDEDYLARAIARLSLSGVAIEAAAYHRGERRLKCDAPLYPFARRRHWLPSDPWCRSGAAPLEAEPHEPETALDASSAATTARDDSAPPETETEREMTAIWSRALGITIQNVNADYFDLGGTSLQGLGLKRSMDSAFGIGILASGVLGESTVRKRAQGGVQLRSRTESDATKA